MKKNIITLLIILGFATSASAQTEEGNWIVGGNLNLSTASNNTQIGITPSIGYFFINNFAGGGNFILDYSKVGETKTTAAGIGPFLRYYFGEANIRPLLHADINFTSNKTKTALGSNTYNGTNYFLGGGLAAFINRNVAIEGLAGYGHTSFRNAGVNASSGGFNLGVGFQVYINRGTVQSMKD